MPTLPSTYAAVKKTPDYSGDTPSIAESVPAEEPGNLQPSGLLNQEAMRGKFSLRRILSTTDGDALEPPERSSPGRPEDPIEMGILNLSIAKSLFENFIIVLNPYISQLDPHLHTFLYVRQKSSFLFTAVLAMSAKTFNPIVYNALYDHAQDLYTESFRNGAKSTEIVQAILILTYWKQPQDTRAWTSLGYAIRMCMDMGWHKLTAYSPASRAMVDEARRREVRNVERTCISLQTGRPWMIERSAFIESIEAWCGDPIADRNDDLLGAFVTLRLMSSSIFSLHAPHSRRSERVPLENTEALLSLKKASIERWERHWIQNVERKQSSEDETCHKFLIRFYGTHFRLQLFSLPLQDVLSSEFSDSSLHLDIIWAAFTGAMDMLKLITRHSGQLYFAQDSIHVMTAYSAAFLVKLLLSAPDTIVQEIETTTVDVIRTAAQAFSQQATAPGTSCELQAGFLHNIAIKLSQRKRTENPTPITKFSNTDRHSSLDQNDINSTRLPFLPLEIGQAMPQSLDQPLPEVFIFQHTDLDPLFTDDEPYVRDLATAQLKTLKTSYVQPNGATHPRVPSCRPLRSVEDDSPPNGEVSLIVPEAGGLRRDLSSRHINMIAIAGMIGTGLFLGSGQAIATAGPAGALLAYIVMGFVTAGVAYTTGEITAFMPGTGGFIRHATKFVEPALGAATGWNFWYTMAITVPAEISAAATVIQFWNDSINPGVWITIFLVVIVTLNLCGSEVVFASLKIMLILGLIIGGLVIDLGGAPNHDRLGFRYWKHPGAFNEYIKTGATGRFLAFWKIMLTAAFSYGNIQVVAISGSETRAPRKIIPAATKKTFYRVLLFYVLSIFIVGLIVPYNDPSLAISTGTAQQSPFVIAFQRSGVKVVPSIINAIVCTSAISSGSACIFIASRTLYGLSCDGHAPRIFQRCNRFGTPHYAIGLTCLLLPLVYLNVANNTSVVFGWFVNITTVSGLIGWVVIEATYLRFYAGLKKQGYSRDALPYKSPLQPYVSWATMFVVSLVIIFSGFDVFVKGKFTAAGFLTCYLNIAIFIVALTAPNGVKWSQPTGLFINNDFVASSNGETIASIDPATEEVIVSVQAASAEDVDKAVKAAKAALRDPSWKQLSASDRGRLMTRLADLIEAKKEVFATIEAWDNGKTYQEALDVDLVEAVAVIRYYAGWADKQYGQTISTTHQKFAYTLRQPIGVIGQIIPWNYPLSMATWKLGPALACGNTVVLKAAEQTPLSILVLGELIKEAGFPPGVVNFVNGFGKDAGSALVNHPLVDKIAFTGSTATAANIMAAAAKTLKNITLETGGKSPLVVFKDADIDQAVKWSHLGIMSNQGQICTATSRILVQDEVYDDFLKRFIETLKAVSKVGSQWEKDTYQGPQVSKAQYDRVLEYIEIGKNEGAKVAAGGHPLDIEGKGKGFFVAPTVFTEVTPSMRVYREEIFGPVVVILRFKREDEALELANNTTYGLGAAVFTTDLERAHRIAAEIESGMVWVNSSQDCDPRVPFGGVKQSGIGRELGEAGLEAYSQIKAVHVNMGNRL
ncbi:Aldehyde/histidinol dehydrogenase [Trichoderma velutinum]